MQIKKQLAETDSVYDSEKLAERIAKLAGGVAVIKVQSPLRRLHGPPLRSRLCVTRCLLSLADVQVSQWASGSWYSCSVPR